MMNQTPSRDLIYGTGDRITLDVKEELRDAVNIPSVSVTSTDNFDVVEDVLKAMCRAAEAVEGGEVVVVGFASSPDRNPEIAFFLGLPLCLVLPLTKVTVLPKSLAVLISSPSITKVFSGNSQLDLMNFTNRYANKGAWRWRWANLFELDEESMTRGAELGCKPLCGMPRAADWDTDDAFIPKAIDEMLKARILAASVPMKEINHANLLYQTPSQRFFSIRQHSCEPNPNWADEMEQVDEPEAEPIRPQKDKMVPTVRSAPPPAPKKPPHRQAWITPDKGLCCLVCDHMVQKTPSALQDHMSSEEHFLRQVMKYAKAQIKVYGGGTVGNDVKETKEDVNTNATTVDCSDCGRSIFLKDVESHMMSPRHLYMLAMGRLTSYKIKKS